jgi:hypothetical protein
MAIIFALAAGGVVYAVMLSNPATVGGNTISTSSANLKVSTDGTQYAAHVSGFDFSNIMPGLQLQPVDGKIIFLRNDGTTSLNLGVAIDPPAAGDVSNIDPSQVYVALTRVGSSTVQQYSLSELSSGQALPLSYMLGAGQGVSYRLQVRVNEGAVSDTTTTAVVGGLMLVFNGTAENT